MNRHRKTTVRAAVLLAAAAASDRGFIRFPSFQGRAFPDDPAGRRRLAGASEQPDPGQVPEEHLLGPAVFGDRGVPLPGPDKNRPAGRLCLRDPRGCDCGGNDGFLAPESGRGIRGAQRAHESPDHAQRPAFQISVCAVQYRPDDRLRARQSPGQSLGRYQGADRLGGDEGPRGHRGGRGR